MNNKYEIPELKAYVKSRVLKNNKNVPEGVYEVTVIGRLAEDNPKDDSVKVSFDGTTYSVKGEDLFMTKDMTTLLDRGYFSMACEQTGNVVSMIPSHKSFMTPDGVVSGENVSLIRWSTNEDECLLSVDGKIYKLPDSIYISKEACLDCESYNVYRKDENGNVITEKVGGRFSIFKLDDEQMKLIKELEEALRKLKEAKVLVSHLSGYEHLHAYSEKVKELSFEDYVDAGERRLPDDLMYRIKFDVAYESEDYGPCMPQ